MVEKQNNKEGMVETWDARGLFIHTLTFDCGLEQRQMHWLEIVGDHLLFSIRVHDGLLLFHSYHTHGAQVNYECCFAKSFS